MKIKFIDRNFSDGSLALVEYANQIIEEYQDRGFRLTLRQLYYQFVARAYIENKQSEYKRLGSIINDARLAGLIDWDAIEDRTRSLDKPPVWESPPDIIKACASQYRRDLWADQPYYVECWIEKEALAGVIEDACKPLRLPFLSCRGYTSQSEMFDAGYRRLRAHRDKEILILHLGDHDPSGIDMTRDIKERLALFTDATIEVKRLALNLDQVELYNPPPNPAKTTDARFVAYRRKFGTESWELDALQPEVIRDLISDAANAVINRTVWDESRKREDKERAALRRLSTKYVEVEKFLRGGRE